MLRVADEAWEVGYEGDVCAVFKMSEEQLSAFLAALKADEGLQEKLKAAANLDAAVAIATDAGFVISAEELQKAQAELSEASELEGVAGGFVGGMQAGIQYLAPLPSE